MWFFFLLSGFILYKTYRSGLNIPKSEVLSNQDKIVIDELPIESVNNKIGIEGNSNPMFNQNDINVQSYINELDKFEYSYPSKVLQDDFFIRNDQIYAPRSIDPNVNDSQFTNELKNIKFDPNRNLIPRSDIIKTKFSIDDL